MSHDLLLLEQLLSVLLLDLLSMHEHRYHGLGLLLRHQLVQEAALFVREEVASVEVLDDVENVRSDVLRILAWRAASRIAILGVV